MIISKITGGMGNQMFQYACAKTISIENNVELKLDIDFYKQQNLRKYELSSFQIREEMASKREIVNLSGNENLWNKIKKKVGFFVHKPDSYYIEKKSALYDKNIKKSGKELYLDGYWQNSRYFDNNRECILHSFSLKEAHSNDICFKNNLHQILESESVALHVRRGDYLLNRNQKHHGGCDLDYYKQAILYIKDSVKNDCMFFIFSDDIFWCQENFDFLDNKIFITGAVNPACDLELMKNCKHNIISNSTFSWWGAWLNDFDDKIVIAPKVWWASRPGETIALDDWIKM